MDRPVIRLTLSEYTVPICGERHTISRSLLFTYEPNKNNKLFTMMIDDTDKTNKQKLESNNKNGKNR